MPTSTSSTESSSEFGSEPSESDSSGSNGLIDNAAVLIRDGSDPNKKRRVIVVGAGMAGIRAANVLHRYGVEVVVLEARADRIGGRMFTKHRQQPDGRIIPREIGAAWMHETANNPMVPLIGKLDLTYYYDDGTPLYYTPYGQVSSQLKAKKVADEFVDYCEWFWEQNPNAPDRSAQDCIKEYVQNHPLLSKEERQWAPEALREVENMTGVNSDLSSAKYLALSYYIIERNLYVTGGYDKVFNYYAEPLKKINAFSMDKVVKQIDYTTDGVTVMVESGSKVSEYRGDAVIVTIPLGCLKKNTICFNPPLASDLQRGIDMFAYKALGKIFFEFSEVFWPRDQDQIVFYPKPRADDEPADENNALHHCYILNNLWLVAGVNELCIQTTEPLTTKLERMNEEELYAFFEPVFEIVKVDRYKDLPDLVSVEATKWTLDPFAGFGTFSAWCVGDNPYVLQEALKNHSGDNLQFAGEHCAASGDGCVHGAFTTGGIAAANILRQFGIDVPDELSLEA